VRLVVEEPVVTVFHPERRRFAAVVAATLALGVSGCAADPAPDVAPAAAESLAAPSATPSPTLDEAALLEQRNVEAASQRVSDYWAASGRVGADGFDGWQDLAKHFTPKLWSAYAQVYGAQAEAGGSSEGAVTVEDPTVVAYEPSENGLERVTLDGCTDWSGITTLDADGVAQERPADVPARYVVRYVVVHTGPDAAWRISDIESHQEETC
jgi:hypothetical protein